jgi:hypothetical protein
LTIELLELDLELPAEGQVAVPGAEASFAAVLDQLTGVPGAPAADVALFNGEATDTGQDRAAHENIVVGPLAILALSVAMEMPLPAPLVADADGNSNADPGPEPSFGLGFERQPELQRALISEIDAIGGTVIVAPDVLDMRQDAAAPQVETDPFTPTAVPVAPAAQGASDEPAGSDVTLRAARTEAPVLDDVVSDDRARLEASARLRPVESGPDRAVGPREPQARPAAHDDLRRSGDAERGPLPASFVPVTRPTEVSQTPAPAPPPTRVTDVARAESDTTPAKPPGAKPPAIEPVVPAAVHDSGSAAAKGHAGDAGDRSFERRGEAPVARATTAAANLARVFGEAAPIETPTPLADPAPPPPPQILSASVPVMAPSIASSESSPLAAPATLRVFAPPAEHDDVVVPQLVRAMHLQLARGVGEARLQLDPRHLGAVSVALRVANGVVSAVVTAEQPSVRHWIEAHESTLRQALADQGLELEKLQVHEDGRSPDGESRHHDEVPRRRSPRRDTATFELVA